MTDENRRLAIAEELRRAQDALRAADLLSAQGLHADAMSRLYYAALYHVRALLLSLGLEARSHEGALRLLGLHFVQPGLVPTRVAHGFARLMKLREEADYNPSFPLDASDVAGQRATVVTLADDCAAQLRAAGYMG